MKFSIIVFPGSNCDHDAYHAAKHVLGQEAEFVWHKETSLKGADVVVLPGGFSHGDYLRTGAIARFSPVMTAVGDFARSGGPVLGICNGFQILCEAGLLPGAMLRNRDLKFHCEHVHIRVEQTDTPFTSRASKGQVLRIPIAHGEGNYYAEPEVVSELEASGRVIFRYCDTRGQVTDAANPERRAERHRRHLQPAAQRRRPDAASGARLRGGARQRRRPRAVRVRDARALEPGGRAERGTAWLTRLARASARSSCSARRGSASWRSAPGSRCRPPSPAAR